MYDDDDDDDDDDRIKIGFCNQSCHSYRSQHPPAGRRSSSLFMVIVERFLH